MIERLLRTLASIGYVGEEGIGEWTATPLTNAMATEGLAAGHRYEWDFVIHSVVKAPKYLRETGHQTPVDPMNGLSQYGHNTRLSCFNYLQSIPSLYSDFNTFMNQWLGSREDWTTWFPTQKLIDGSKSDTTLLIDIGGGKGQDLEVLRARHPDCGKLVLQELPQVLQGMTTNELDPSIERMEHDFFTEQPVKGTVAALLITRALC